MRLYSLIKLITITERTEDFLSYPLPMHIAESLYNESVICCYCFYEFTAFSRTLQRILSVEKIENFYWKQFIIPEILQHYNQPNERTQIYYLTSVLSSNKGMHFKQLSASVSMCLTN